MLFSHSCFVIDVRFILGIQSASCVSYLFNEKHKQTYGRKIVIIESFDGIRDDSKCI